MSYETEPEFALASLRTRNDPRHVLARRAALAAMTGTAIEYYEFGIYGFMAAVIGPLFFPERPLRRLYCRFLQFLAVPLLSGLWAEYYWAVWEIG